MDFRKGNSSRRIGFDCLGRSVGTWRASVQTALNQNLKIVEQVAKTDTKTCQKLTGK